MINLKPKNIYYEAIIEVLKYNFIAAVSSKY